MTHILTRGIIISLIVFCINLVANSQNTILDKLNKKKLTQIVIDLQNAYNISSQSIDTDNTINYTLPFYYFKKYLNNNKIDSSIYFEQFGQSLARVGLYADAIQAFDNLDKYRFKYKPRKFSHNDSLLFDSIKTTPAFDYIFKKLDNSRVVMINEAHHIPVHRIFTYSLLKEMYNKGYKYLCMEAYYGKATDTCLNQSLRNGELTKEVNYANMVKYAKKIGLKLISYDYLESSDNNDREVKAFSIIDSLLSSDSAIKIIVHAGYGHIEKKSLSSRMIPLGFLINEKYKIISISQTSHQESATINTPGNLVYNYIKAKTPFDVPQILIKDNVSFNKFTKPLGIDYNVITPSYFNFSNKYLKENTDLIYKLVQINKSEANNGFLLQVFDKAEINNDSDFLQTIPLANMFIQENKFEYKLLFPRNKKYWLIVRDNLNNIISKRKFK